MTDPGQIPTSFGHELRACLGQNLRSVLCIENCPFFKMHEDTGRVGEGTTPNFTGIISVMDPARRRFVPGCYTLSVSEALPSMCQEERVQYVPPRV